LAGARHELPERREVADRGSRRHRLEDPHAAEVRVDAPTLPGDVGGPHEADAVVAPRHRKRSGERLTGEPVIGFRAYPVIGFLSWTEAGDPATDWEVSVR
jgi:hypothetical protein